MYRLLIIDDEIIVLEAYSYIIENHYDNIEIQTAKNGKEGLMKLEDFRPHIVMTDIRMPGISGLEFIKEARKIDHSVKILIVTAYEQFEYAKESFQYNIEDYVLKPLTKSKLIEYINKTITNIENENSRRNKELDGIEKYYKSIGLLESNFLNNIVLGRNILKYLDEYRDLFSLALIKGHFITIKFSNLKETTNWSTVEEYNAKINDCYDYLKTHVKYNFNCLISNVVADRIYIYLEVDNQFNKESTIDFLEKAHKKILDAFGLKSRISIGSEKNIDEIFSSYEESQYNLIYTKKNVEMFQYRQAIKSDTEELLSQLENLQTYFIMKNDKFFSCIRRIAVLYEPLLVSNETLIINALYETYILIYHIAKEANIIPRDIYSTKKYMDEILYITPLEKISIFDKNIKILFKFYKELKNYNYSDITIKAIEIIEANRFNEISLEEVSREIGVSSQYLSKVFKINTSKGFKEYHKEIRMNEAKKLLFETDLSIHEISERLSYSDSNYFIRTFKKSIGCTPNEYRKG